MIYRRSSVAKTDFSPLQDIEKAANLG